jgi:hypothetical protein
LWWREADEAASVCFAGLSVVGRWDDEAVLFALADEPFELFFGFSSGYPLAVGPFALLWAFLVAGVGDRAGWVADEAEREAPAGCYRVEHGLEAAYLGLVGEVVRRQSAPVGL